MRKLNFIHPTGLFLLIAGMVFIIYSEYHNRKSGIIPEVIKSDALFYHEYIATYLYGAEPYVPREQKPVIKYTMGMAFTYLPGVALGYVISEIKGLDHNYGRNYVYQHVLYYLGLLYSLIGLYFLIKILKQWFSESFSIFITSIIFLGTNLYYYVRLEPLMTHAVGFALVASFIYFTLQFIKSPDWKNCLALAFSLGILTLIRPTNLVIVLFPLVFLVTNKNLFSFITRNLKYLLGILIVIGLLFIPQLLYWHTYTGEWLYYSYRHEKFFWNKPAILQVLISFRKGWFIYTPLMILALPGAFICYQRNKPVFWAILIFSIVNIYIISCWWCWWYGGSFGMRPMIDSYALFAIWIAYFFDYLVKKSRIVFVSAIIVVGFLIYLNLFQTRQAKECWIHFDSMTYTAYKRVFLNNKIDFTREEWEAMLDQPNYTEAERGKRFW